MKDEREDGAIAPLHPSSFRLHPYAIMQLQTFKAPTMAECLTQVKTAMGAEAIILHTRTYQTKLWMGLRRQEVVEITAGKGMNIGRRPRPGQQPPADAQAGGVAARGKDPRPNPAMAGTYSRSGAARSSAMVGGNASAGGHGGGGGGTAVAEPPVRAREPRHLMETPAVTGAAMLSLTQEVTTLKQMMKELIVVSRQRQAPNVPEELFEYYDLLVRNQVCEELATDLVRTLARQVRADHYGNAAYMRERLGEQIEKMIPLAGPIARSAKATRPHVVALVGPTGVGKTTTIAKLAANLKLKDRHKVGLITLDTYRIAAVDQLRRYAEIIGAPLKVVGSADELREAIKAMADVEYVLIDTAGRSPNDRLKIGELKKVLEAAEPDEVHLVLSTTVSPENVELAVTQFGEVRVDRVIFTKLDEAAHLGVLLNVVRKVNKGLSYVTTGQDVPDDIEVGQGKRLAQLVMGDGI